MFHDRKDAGIQLAKKLEHYREKNVLVLAIPRGGVEVAYFVACYLDAELSLIIPVNCRYQIIPREGSVL